MWYIKVKPGTEDGGMVKQFPDDGPIANRAHWTTIVYWAIVAYSAGHYVNLFNINMTANKDHIHIFLRFLQ